MAPAARPPPGGRGDRRRGRCTTHLRNGNRRTLGHHAFSRQREPPKKNGLRGHPALAPVLGQPSMAACGVLFHPASWAEDDAENAKDVIRWKVSAPSRCCRWDSPPTAVSTGGEAHSLPMQFAGTGLTVASMTRVILRDWLQPCFAMDAGWISTTGWIHQSQSPGHLLSGPRKGDPIGPSA